MSIRHLDNMFKPSSICVIGASLRRTDIGQIVIRNLIQGNFDGPIMPVTSDCKSVCGILSYPSINDLPMKADLAIICSPASLIEECLSRLGENGIKAVIIMSDGSYYEGQKKAFNQKIIEISSRYQMRILGPNTLGAIVPGANLNASILHLPVKQGKIAYISQSGAMSTTVLDWANAHGIGFSHFISMGDCAGLDFGDIIDYLGRDPFTRAILIYMESIHERRNFLSAARASARNKPILVIKAGQNEEMSKKIQSHTGVMAAADLVYEAAFRRAGMLRVNSTAELFAGAETLSMTKPFKGKNLGILTNGGGLGVMAVDHLMINEGTLAAFTDDTMEKLEKCLPMGWSKSNPIDMSHNAPIKSYEQIYEVLKKAKEVNCILWMYAPSAFSDSVTCAEALIAAHKKHKGNLITCWAGEATVLKARKLLEANNIPTYSSPRMAVMAFMHIVKYQKNHDMLMETPERVPSEIKPARSNVRIIIDEALSNQDRWLKETDCKAILKAYGIDVIESHIATTTVSARQIASDIGFPVVVKIMSPDIIHKSDVGGVVLSLQNADSVEEAINAITKRVLDFDDNAKINGFIIQKMMSRHHSHELIAGMTHDPIFGPVILFGEGGTATEIIGDRAVALPPLNMGLAKDLISRTKISKLLTNYRDHPAADMDALCQLLIELSEICIDFPEIQEIDINPIFASSKGALAVDARMRIKECHEKFPNRRLAIRPYPSDLEEEFVMRNGRKVFIRPIKPEDEPGHEEFMKHITPQDIRFRFFGSIRQLPHSEMARLTQLDYDREMAFIAQAPNEEDGHLETLGVVRTGTDSNNEDAEYAILVRSDLKGQKLGWKLLNKMIDYSRSRGTVYFTGQILRENRTMIEMVKSMGFETHTIIEDDIVEVRLKL